MSGVVTRSATQANIVNFFLKKKAHPRHCDCWQCQAVIFAKITYTRHTFPEFDDDTSSMVPYKPTVFVDAHILPPVVNGVRGYGCRIQEVENSEGTIWEKKRKGDEDRESRSKSSRTCTVVYAHVAREVEDV